MTVEPLKAFITLPTTTVYKDGGAGRRSSHQRARLFCFSLFLAAFCVTVSCYQIWNFLRTNELRAEVDLLRDKVENMRKRMGLDMFDELEDFENVYSPPYLEDSEEDSINEVFSDDLSDFDEDIEDEVYDLDAELKLHPEDDDEEEADSGSGLLLLNSNNNDEDYDLIRKGRPIPRKPRAVSSSQQVSAASEVPIVEESYAVRRNKTNAATDERIAKLLLKKSGGPTMHYDWTEKSANERNAPVTRSRHHQPRRHMKKYMEHRGPPTLYVTRHQAAGAVATPPTTSASDDNNGPPQINIRHNNHHQQPQQQQLRTRQDVNRKLPHSFQESRAHPELVAYPPTRRLARKSGRSTGRAARLIAVQFNGDTNSYVEGRHEHYLGNGLLRHSGVYSDWVTAPWVTNMSLDRHFHMNNGVLTVHEAGLYYVYAQILYKDNHDRNGFVIEQNGRSILQCSAMTHSATGAPVTCHTSGVTFLQPNDELRVVDLGHNRHVLLEHHRSFFGLMRVANMQHRVQESTDSPGPN